MGREEEGISLVPWSSVAISANDHIVISVVFGRLLLSMSIVGCAGCSLTAYA